MTSSAASLATRLTAWTSTSPSSSGTRWAGQPRRVLTRRRLEIALGVLWLADGLLQFQPYMFTHAFFADLLSMANMGLPGWLSGLVFRITDMLTAHPVVWNTLFATLQVALGVGLIWPRTARLARPVSVAWALGVWVVGEGVGALFMPGTGALNGAPGAALLYAVLAVLLWPRPGGAAGRRGAAVSDEGVPGGRIALACWAVLWAGLAALELAPANHDPAVPAGEASGVAAREPGWLAALNTHAGHQLAGRGVVFAVAAGLAMLVIAVAVLHPRSRRAALVAGAVLAAVFGLIGQDFGGLLTGQATDPGTAPLLVLLALALWPRRAILPAYTPGPVCGLARAGATGPAVQPATSPDSTPSASGPSRPAAVPIDPRIDHELHRP